MPTIRSARPDDVPQVLSLWIAARSAAASTPDTQAAVKRLLIADPHALLVAELDGRVIGTLIAAADGWRGNMYRLAVDREWRRRGIARALVGAGEDHLRDLGILRVTALVARDDIEARALWEASGYRYDVFVGRFVRNL